MTSWRDMFQVFGRIGLLSFGGPAAQISLMHRELVEQRDWLSEQAYLRALSLCMLLPGPEAMQLATYAGWRMRGVQGGLLAGALFVLPGAAVIFALALFYASFGTLPLVQAAFVGIKAAVIVVVFQALRRLSGKALVGRTAWMLAIGAFLALFAFGLPFPLVIAVAAAVGAWSPVASAPPETVQVPGTPLRTLFIWGGLWLFPLAVLWALDQAFLLQLGLFFSKLAVVTFGGAYAVLAYMTQTVVSDFGWLTTQQMIDALGLAETTPGPLILVTEFVALLAGHAASGLTGAISAGLVALWVTFMPCFLWIFLAAPYLDRIAGHPRVAASLQAITAAVVGVIANLSLWFALHVLFRIVSPGILALPNPDLTSFDRVAAVMVVLAAVLMLGLKKGFVQTMLSLTCLCLGWAIL